MKSAWPPGQSAPGWCEAQLDPEGVLASVPCVLTVWLGMHVGLVLTHYKDHDYRAQTASRMWTVFSSARRGRWCVQA